MRSGHNPKQSDLRAGEWSDSSFLSICFVLVRKAIDEITQGKISFIIAHRLSTIKKCDKILLMKDGKVIEEGRHDELVEKQGEYYSLINMGKGD